jgi:hypothetical protein
MRSADSSASTAQPRQLSLDSSVRVPERTHRLYEAEVGSLFQPTNLRRHISSHLAPLIHGAYAGSLLSSRQSLGTVT